MFENLSAQYTHRNVNYFTMLQIRCILIKRFHANIDTWKTSDRWHTTQICGHQADQAKECGKQEHHVHRVVFSHKCGFSKDCQGFCWLSIGRVSTMHNRSWVPCICTIANGGLCPTTRTLLVWTVQFCFSPVVEPNANPNKKLEQNRSFQPSWNKTKTEAERNCNFMWRLPVYWKTVRRKKLWTAHFRVAALSELYIREWREQRSVNWTNESDVKTAQ